VTIPEPTATKARPHRPAADQPGRLRLVLAGVIGPIVTAFALLNFNNVTVHWLVATGDTPLIAVIVLAFGVGILLDRLLVLRGSRKRPRSPRFGASVVGCCVPKTVRPGAVDDRRHRAAQARRSRAFSLGPRRR
jgi:uncharacterized integral membrane protein